MLLKVSNRDRKVMAEINTENFSKNILAEAYEIYSNRQIVLKGMVGEAEKQTSTFLEHLELVEKWWVPFWWPPPKELSETNIEELSKISAAQKPAPEVNEPETEKLS